MATLRELPAGFTPRAVITALGTEVFVDGELLESWRRGFHGFDREPIDRAMEALGLQPHAEEMQTPLKASFSVPRACRWRRRSRSWRSCRWRCGRSCRTTAWTST